jgi:hypothetical protein
MSDQTSDKGFGGTTRSNADASSSTKGRNQTLRSLARKAKRTSRETRFLSPRSTRRAAHTFRPIKSNWEEPKRTSRRKTPTTMSPKQTSVSLQQSQKSTTKGY